MSLVEVQNLRIELTSTGDDVCDGLSFSIDAGEVVGLVGESGSGKSTAAMALLGHARQGVRIVAGRVVIDGVDMLSLPAADVASRRGRVVSYVPQDPATALNPARRLRGQMLETLAAHDIGADTRARLEMVRATFAEVKLPADDEFIARYPHQLSGGQQQRVCIAMAIVCAPRVIVLDEPTTGLDVSTQAHFLQTVTELAGARSVAILYVSHDLAVIANLARHVLVMYGGRIVEAGTRDEVFRSPGHPYTRRLLGAMPDVGERRHLETLPGRPPAPGTRPTGCVFSPRCTYVVSDCVVAQPPLARVGGAHRVACIRTDELANPNPTPGPLSLRRKRIGSVPILTVNRVTAVFGDQRVLHDVSLDLWADECVALVGESGSGKTTLARAIIGLHPAYQGSIHFDGQLVARKARDRSSTTRRELQYIFQNPYKSLNPRHRVEDIVATPLRLVFGVGRREAHRLALDSLERVALAADVAPKYPDQLSGGERQRVAIARALVCSPRVLVCDEITSALDVSVQATVIELLARLRREEKLSLLFITHNLALVRSIADRTVVLSAGSVVEQNDTEQLLTHPENPYTSKLLADTPRLEPIPLPGRAAR